MTTHTIKADRNTTLTIPTDGDTWIIDKASSFTMQNMTAISISTGFDDNTFRIAGDLFSPSQSAISNGGAHSTFRIGASASIIGSNGIFGLGSDARVLNAGDISATEGGVRLGAFSTVVNSGDISAPVGIMVGTISTITNEKDGRIFGGNLGVLMDADGTQTLTNHGLIAADNNAIQTTGGDDVIVNDGRIEGNVELGEGFNTFDSRGGVLLGTVHGGTETDVYRISQSSLKIAEDDGGSSEDTVYSSVSYTLQNNLEYLRLTGKGDINGHGNGADNILFGNAGDNKLFGGGDSDNLNGFAGNDRLFGGAGLDQFVFAKGTGTDRVMDFVDLEDAFVVLFSGIDSFTDLMPHIAQHDDDVWISIGTDRLVIVDTAMAELDNGEFTFSTT